MSLKRWAVRQIAGLLSDYLEGITEQNLQASLSLEVGEVEIRHVRLQPCLLSDRHFQLLSSDVSVSARIPWRNLGSEPTVITVREVWAEVHAEPVEQSAGGEEDDEGLERWRERRRRQVQAHLDAAREAAVAAAAANEGAEEPSKRRSLAKRLGHAALRQLQLRVEGLRMRVHPESEAAPPLDLSCGRLALDEGSAASGKGGVADVPAEVRKHVASLDKVLEVVGLSAQLQGRGGSSAAEWQALDRRGLRELLADAQRRVMSAQDGEALAAAQCELLEVKEQLQRSGCTPSPVLGPLALEARLWHSVADGLLWLCAQLQVEEGAAAVRLSPPAAQHLLDGLGWYQRTLQRPPPTQAQAQAQAGEAAREASGPEYLELCLRRGKEEATEVDLATLREIEDVAPVPWLAKWQLRCQEQLSAVEQPPPAPPGRSVIRWLARRWSRPDVTAEAAPSSLSLSQSQRSDASACSEQREGASGQGGTRDDDDNESIDELGGEEGILQEVEEPRRVELRCVIPHCTILTCHLDSGSASDSTLRLEGGVECRAAIASAQSGQGGSLFDAAWDADVQANLSSIAVLLDKEPLMLLDKDPLTLLRQESSRDAPSTPQPAVPDAEEAGEEEFYDVESEDECEDVLPKKGGVEEQGTGEAAAVNLSVVCARHGGSSSSSAGALPWALRVRLKQEPFRFLLGPRSTRCALDLVIALARSIGSSLPLSSAQAQPHAQPISRMSSISDFADTEPAATPGVAEEQRAEVGEGSDFIALDLDLDVAAPVLRWGLLPRGHMTIALGRLLFRTCGVAPPPAQLTAPERSAWPNFACYCQLTEASVATQGEDGSECRVFDPSTICLRAWREGDGGGWQLSVDTEAWVWTVSPSVLEVAGQLPLSLDYAISPLRGVLVDSTSLGRSPAGREVDGQTSPSTAAAPGDSHRDLGSISESRASTAAGVQGLSVHICLRRSELICSMQDQPRCISLRFEGITAEYSARLGVKDALCQVANCELSHLGTRVVSCTSGGSVTVKSADRHLAVSGSSTLIAVEWHERSMRGLLAAFDEGCESLQSGHDDAQGLLHVGDSAGMFAQLWARHVIRPIQTRLHRQVASRMKALQPGLSPPATAQTDGAEAWAPAATDRFCLGEDERELQPRGECSVEVCLSYEGLMVAFPEEGAGPEAKPCLQVAVTGAECHFCGYRSGDAQAVVSLNAADLDLQGRRLLTPRRADKLLRVDITRMAFAQRVTQWTASWAQVCVLFRQRDYDFLSQFLRSSVFGVLRSRRRTETPQLASAEALPLKSATSETLTGAAAPATEEPPPARPSRFRLDIGAPLVFLPTDGSALLVKPREADGEGERPSAGPTRAGSGDSKLGVVDAASGEPGYLPEPGEGCLVFDFGHVAVSGGGEGSRPGDVGLQLRGAHILGIPASPAADGRARDVLCPVSLDAELKLGEGPIEFHAVSAVEKAGGEADRPASTPCSPCGSPRDVDHRLSLTRAQLTLILDVLAENICYAGRSGKLAAAAAASRPAEPASQKADDTPTAKSGGKGRGFRFSWSWAGELVFDVAFTESVPLGRLRLRGGRFSIDNSSEKSRYEVCCTGISALDLRKGSRNADKTLLECAPRSDGEPSFEVNVEIPAEADSTTTVQLSQPVMQVLPQLVMDLISAGLSAWQHCTFRNDRQQQPQQPQQPPRPQSSRTPHNSPNRHATPGTVRGTRVQVNLLDGVFRIAEHWGDPTGHFEFAGSLPIAILAHSQGIRIERFDLERGCLRLRSATQATPTMICPCLEWILRGEQCCTDDERRMKRQRSYDLRSVIVPPYSIRMSMRDHRAMVRALAELLSLDSEPSEPASELASRDPLALQLVENRLVLTAQVALEGAEVQVMGEEGGHAWPGLMGHMRCPLFEVTVETRLGQAPTVNLYAKELELDLFAHNHRLGAWEPVVPRCCWEVSYHMQRKPDGGPREVLIRSDVKAKLPVHLVVSATSLHTATRVFRVATSEMRYGHLLAALNISGVACKVAVDGGEEGLLAAETHAQPLDWLLKGSTRMGQQQDPFLTLEVADQPGGAPCRIPLGREVCIPWDTGVAGLLVCRLIMPRPPQHLLLVSSTVCIWNRTPSDLEVRFMEISKNRPPAGEAGLRPICPPGAFRSVDARCVQPGAGAAVMPDEICGNGASSSSRPPNAPPGCGADGALTLGAGQMLSAPPEAQLVVGQAALQIRPAYSGDISYEWSDTFYSVPAGRPDGGGETVCSAPPPALHDTLPRHWLHLRMPTDTPEDAWCTVEVQAPFTLVNACPCDLLCRLNPSVQKTGLYRERERLPLDAGATRAEVVVSDGRGGEVWVPARGTAEVLPLRLDAEGYFHWVCNNKAVKTKVSKRRTNCLVAALDLRRREVVWEFAEVTMKEEQMTTPLRITPQSSLPVYDMVAEDLSLALALKDESGTKTSWSFPVQAVTTNHSVEETIELVRKGMYVQLNTRRQGRELVVYAQWWFANSTGLDVGLLQPWGPGPMHPVPSFGAHVSFLPQVRNDAGDGVVNLQLAGAQPVEARVPDVGGAEPVQLTPLHRCSLHTETVALPENMRGVSSYLVSLLPAILLFNRVDIDMEVGFRQTTNGQSSKTTWVRPGGNGVLWWAHKDQQSLQVALRERGSKYHCTVWSSPFEVRETRIGAYPLALKCTQPQPYPFLICLCIDEDAAALSITAYGAGSCHTLLNQNPSIGLSGSIVEAPLEDCYTFQVRPGERSNVAGPAPLAVPRLILKVWELSHPREHAVTVHLPLNRSGKYTLPLETTKRKQKKVNPSGSSTLRTPTIVSIELRNRVAMVTALPGVVQSFGGEETVESSEEAARTIDGELHLESLSIALLTEGLARPTPRAQSFSSSLNSLPQSSPRAASMARLRYEAFTVHLKGVKVQLAQTPDRRRGVDFEIRDVQVGLQHPETDTLLRNISQPFLKTRTLRDDVRMLDVHLKHVEVTLGELEVSVTGAAWEQLQLFRRSLAPGSGGLTFEQVKQRAVRPYHTGELEPPEASSKMVVNKLEISHAKVDVWCQLSLPDAHYLPKSLRDTLQFVSGTNRLEVRGAQLKLPQQALFSPQAPGEGSLGALLARVSDHYLPHVKSCWRSLLQHSNIFLGGLLSRHTWAPRQRRHPDPGPPLCGVGQSGEVCFPDVTLCRP